MKTSTISTTAGSNLRTRLYWVWQAWRLRKAAAVEAAGSAGVYTNFAAIERRGHADSLCELAEALSATTPGLVATTASDVRARLVAALGTRSCAVVLGAGAHGTGGYAWGRVDDGAQVLASLRRLPSLAAVSERDWGIVTVAVGSRAMLVLDEIGLDPRYRYGFSPLKQLLKPLFDLGVAHGVRRAVWWAPRSSPLYGLSLAFGARAIGGDEGVAFFIHNDVAAIARVLGTLSAGEISSRLARVGPPREQQARMTALPAHVSERLAVARTSTASESEPDVATYAAYKAAIAAADYPQLRLQPAANDAGAAPDDATGCADAEAADGFPDTAAASPRARLAGQHSPLLALPQRLSALFPGTVGG